ncbi:MAG: hypothetical protein HOI95_21460 [Chromatiales bacterium]|jgi:hypothetical protein|nr:hypothetical protein [Chromatiales bacterium]
MSGVHPPSGNSGDDKKMREQLLRLLDQFDIDSKAQFDGGQLRLAGYNYAEDMDLSTRPCRICAVRGRFRPSQGGSFAIMLRSPMSTLPMPVLGSA